MIKKYATNGATHCVRGVEWAMPDGEYVLLADVVAVLTELETGLMSYSTEDTKEAALGGLAAINTIMDELKP